MWGSYVSRRPHQRLAGNEKIAAAKLEALYRAAQRLLRDNYEFMIAVQQALLDRETLLGSDIARIRDQIK